MEVRWIDRGEPIGKRRVFATRTCCGPDGEGPCKSEAEGLPCGIADVPTFAPIPLELLQRGQGLRKARLDLGLSLRDAATRIGIRPSEVSALENGRAEVDDWSALRDTLRGGPIERPPGGA